MFVTIRKYKLAGSFAELNEKARESFLPILKELPGLKAYHTIDCGDGYVASVTVFESLEAGMKAARRAREWVAIHVAHIIPEHPEVIAGETGFDFMAL